MQKTPLLFRMHGAVGVVVAQRITANTHQERLVERGLYTAQVFFFFPVRKKHETWKHSFFFSFFVTTVYDIYVHKHFSYPRNKRKRRINYWLAALPPPCARSPWDFLPVTQGSDSAMNGYRRQSCRACTIKVRARERGMSHRTQKIEDEHTTLIYSGRDYKILSTWRSLCTYR